MNIILTILILGIIIVLHEFGHYIMAKLFNMPVLEFSIGMGKRLWGIKKGETTYNLRLLPIGGYVRIEGMVEEESIIYEENRSFYKQSKTKRLVVLFAGIFMNFITGIIAFSIFSLLNDKSLIDSIKIGFVMFYKVFTLTLSSLFGLFTGGISANDLVGPVGMPKIISDILNTNGNTYIAYIIGLLAVNIGIMNFIPIPALDGGRILFVLLEIFGIKNKKMEMFFQIAGIVLILSLTIFILFNDIYRLFR